DAGGNVANAMNQLNDVRFRHIEQTLNAERVLRASAEAQATEARKALYDIAAAYCSEALDTELREHKAAVGRWSNKQLVEFIHRHLVPRLNRAEAGDRLGRQFEAAQEQVESLQEQVAKLKANLAEQEATSQRLDRELAATKSLLQDAVRKSQQVQTTASAEAVSQGDHTTAATRTVAPGVRVVESPGEWFGRWKSERGFERSRDLVQVLGATGWCRRTALQSKLNERWGVSTHRAIGEAVDLAAQYELVEIQTAEQAQGQPQIISLSERGQETFLLLFERDPVPSELIELTKRHKSLEHVLLNLEAAGALRQRLNAVVDLYPPVVVLDGGRQFAPDLMVALPEGDVIYVECERNTPKNRDERNRKWRNVYDATGGRFYIVCFDKRSRKKIESEVNIWLNNAELPGTVCATDLASLSNHRDGQFWLSQKSKKAT
ncbi:MAG: hypothetical protein JXA89_12150, partial [Anaerolineae bacterium]|nr:hypothetical protein [Anaerolineae bacterium]